MSGAKPGIEPSFQPNMGEGRVRVKPDKISLNLPYHREKFRPLFIMWEFKRGTAPLREKENPLPTGGRVGRHPGLAFS